MRISDWSSDVCSSDLLAIGGIARQVALQLVLALEGRRRSDLRQRRRRDEEVLCQALHRAQQIRRHHRSEEHTSELQSLMRTSYAVFCLKKHITALTNWHLPCDTPTYTYDLHVITTH